MRRKPGFATREILYRDLLNALPAAIYTTDADGRITFYNEAAVAFSGRRPALGSDSWCVSWKLFRPDGTPLPHDRCPMAVALKTGQVESGAEAVAERPDGSRVHFMPYPTVFKDASGKVLRRGQHAGRHHRAEARRGTAAAAVQ